jgi:CheY-like chemotaxis protein
MSRLYKILWAEDEDTLREIMCELLTEEGLNCTQARDGAHAREMMLQERFDLIITDFNMPHMNGAELLFWARQSGIHIPFIFVTANVERLPIEKLALNDCCASIINKPFAIEALLSEIEKAQKRNHQFECKGEIRSPLEADFKNSFPHQHFISGSSSDF